MHVVMVLCSVAQSCPNLCDPLACVACQAPMEFSRQENWSRLPSPTPGNLPNPGTEPASPALAGRFFSTMLPGKPQVI